jgi:hypothetical protein
MKYSTMPCADEKLVNPFKVENRIVKHLFAWNVPIHLVGGRYIFTDFFFIIKNGFARSNGKTLWHIGESATIGKWATCVYVWLFNNTQ